MLMMQGIYGEKDKREVLEATQAHDEEQSAENEMIIQSTTHRQVDADS